MQALFSNITSLSKTGIPIKKLINDTDLFFADKRLVHLLW